MLSPAEGLAHHLASVGEGRKSSEGEAPVPGCLWSETAVSYSTCNTLKYTGLLAGPREG